jgi:hypothetical protein
MADSYGWKLNIRVIHKAGWDFLFLWMIFTNFFLGTESWYFGRGICGKQKMDEKHVLHDLVLPKFFRNG